MAGWEGLGAIFLAHLDGGAGSRPLPDGLDDVLGRLWETARAEWPGLVVDAPLFVAHFAKRVAPDHDLQRTLAEVHAADLYLACACTRGDGSALRRFEDRYGAIVVRSLRRINDAPSFADEAQQQLREKLFMSAGGAPPRIEGYSGRGPLGSWLTIAARRTGLNLLRSQKPHAVATEGADALPAPGNPELDVLRSLHEDAFREAFHAAIAKLDRRDRMILRLYFVRRLSQDKIAPLYNVHQTTVMRWIGSAQQQLLTEMRRDLQERLKVSPSEVQSIAYLLASQIELNLSRWLGEDPEDRG
jgi:RNA polymerase sigma-70 factor (ECF subfamily)